MINKNIAQIIDRTEALIKIKKIYSDASLPTYGSEEAAGCDLYAYIKNIEENDCVIILPHTTTKIGTGIALSLPVNYFGGIFARSGLATKQNLRPANCVGVCDSDYRGEYIVSLYNDSDKAQIIHHGDRIAQLVLLPSIKMIFKEVEELSETQRGAGGFGSTDIK